MSPAGDSSDPVALTVTNADTGDVTLFLGVSASLKIVLVNNSGAAIDLPAGPAAATFGVYLPRTFFGLARLQAIKVTADGWAGTLDAAHLAINIACTQAATWAEGARLTFTLTGVVAEGTSGTGKVMIVPSNMTGSVPASLVATLGFMPAPEKGNLRLPDVLQVTLDNQGSVLRSASLDDPLANTLYLTLKNVGATPLATGPTMAGSPQVVVSFVYGNTSGALAPDSYDPTKHSAPRDSAWNITVGIPSAQSSWTAVDPAYVSADHDPEWVLTPSQDNLQLLGPAGTDQANVTFSFSDLVTGAPLGHTQMFVNCTGFAKDASTRYDPYLFVLDLVKVDPPPTRGLLSFFGPDPVISADDPDAQISIPLRWAMFDVACVRLLTSSPAVAPLRKAYAVPPKPLDYDEATVKMQAPQASEAVFITLQAFGAGGAYLNSQQFTAYVQTSYVIDAAGTVYPIALFGSTFWMLKNYEYPAQGSYDYGDDAGYAATFGRLYQARRAQALAPPGWSLPTEADWNALLHSFGDARAAYATLIAGGKSGFNAQLGGQRSIQPDGSGAYQDICEYGYYLASPGNVFAQFSGDSAQASVGTPMPSPQTAMSVRYIKHA